MIEGEAGGKEREGGRERWMEECGVAEIGGDERGRSGKRERKEKRRVYGGEGSGDGMRWCDERKDGGKRKWECNVHDRFDQEVGRSLSQVELIGLEFTLEAGLCTYQQHCKQVLVHAWGRSVGGL